MRSALACLLLLACTPKEPVDLGGPCSGTDKMEACAVGKLAVCSGGKWAEMYSCPSPTACKRQSVGHGRTAPICDDARGRVGNVCNSWGQKICSEDGHAQLACEKGRWRQEKACPTGCSWPKTGISCQ